MARFEEALSNTAKLVDEVLAQLLPIADGPESRLYEAMRYAALGPGKRLRPFLVTTSAGIFDVSEESALRVAAAIEMVHCYSLIHDDLPAMDDDDLRRGKPTVHVEFDEATAILAGDALLTLAFEVLADPATHANGMVRCELVTAMARAAGSHGMVGGQMIDLLAEHMDLDIGAIARLERLKTGEIIAYSSCAGAILARAPKNAHFALHAYAHDLGLAFQIVDDLLDAEGSEAELGKRVGKDAEAGKATFVSLLGNEGARDRARMLSQQAVAHLDIFGDKADLLRDTAHFVVERRA